MYVCEYEFVNEDKKHPGYSMTEIDFYAWIPGKFHKEHGNHRLTLWKNHKTNQYELIKVFMNQVIQPIQFQKNVGMMITNLPTGETVEVIFKNESLEACLVEGAGLWNKFHGTEDYQKEVDEVCDHSWKSGSFCMKRYIEEKEGINPS
jgi:hypothetical protein